VYHIWLASLFLACGVWIGLPLLLPSSGRETEAAPFVVAVFFAIAAADLTAGWWFKSRALNPRRHAPVTKSEEAVGLIVGQSLVAVSMSSTPTAFAFLVYWLTGNVAALSGLCALSLLGLLVLRPRIEEWQETLRGI
jgi:hypothetical protein